VGATKFVSQRLLTPFCFRAIEALEQIATPEARQVLEAQATSAPNPQVAEAATAALKRMGQRQ